LILRFGTTSLERRLVSPPSREIKLAIYYTSIKQREHTYCCQLIFPQLRLWREPRKPPRAYVPSQPAVKSSQPQVIGNVFRLQRYIKKRILCIFGLFFCKF
jgi:hypothetical protein